MPRSEVGALLPDTNVIIAFQVQGKPMAINARVVSESGVKLFTRDRRVQGVEFPQSVYIVWHEGDDIRKAEAMATGVTILSDGFNIDLEKTVVNEADRRVYPRHAIEVPFNVRSVNDVTVPLVISLSMGITKDISLGGAWVEIQPTVPMGTIVEFAFNLDGEDIKGLALVAHANPSRKGNGLEFLDLYGDSRDRLTGKLRVAA